MRYPGYLLNPGDMFQVEPERALWGLGSNAGPMGRMRQIMTTDMNILWNPPPPPPKRLSSRTMSTSTASAEPTEEAVDDEELDEILEDDEADAELDEVESDVAVLKARKGKLRDLLSQTRDMLDRGKAKKTIDNTMKQAMRAFVKDLRKSQSRVRSLEDTAVVDLESRFTELSNSVKRTRPAPQKRDETPEEEPEQEEETPERRALRAGPRWNAREFLSPFAFIPKYLEVNHAICSAVYLRHPVCGPGFAEVPTPFGIETGGLAFNWYLRRR